jgi:aspartyl-tRNA(Asn)/glutamyl-tRNA(Gln) amidotransferase subunit A
MARDLEALTLREFRVAFSPTLGYGKVDAAVLDVVNAAVERLRSSFAVVETVSDAFPDPAEILSAEFIGGCSARLGDLVETAPELIDPPLLEAVREFRQMSADRYTRLLRRRLEHRERVGRFFQRYDLLLTPTTPCVAWPIELPLPPGHEDATVWSYFTYPFNLTGQPAASLPCGVTDDGLPIGLQIVAPLCAESILIQALRLAVCQSPRYDW